MVFQSPYTSPFSTVYDGSTCLHYKALGYFIMLVSVEKLHNSNFPANQCGEEPSYMYIGHLAILSFKSVS